MAEDVVRPQDVLKGDLKEQLIEAVIDAYMAKGAVESGAVNLEFKAKESEDGHPRYVYTLPVKGAGDPEICCDYPSGQWLQRKSGWFDSDLDGTTDYADAGDNSYEVRIFDAPGTWDALRQEVAAWVDPWVNDCPSPNVYTNQINSIATIARQLYVGNAPAPGSTATGAPDSADLDLWDAMTELHISADSTSLAVDAFQRTYSTDIWKTVGGQQSMVFAAGLALTAEGLAWSETYRSLRDTLLRAAHDFASFAGSREAKGEKVDAFLNTTSKVAGLLGGAGKVWPPFGSAMKAVTGGIAAYRFMNPPQAAVLDQSLVLSGDTFDAKMTSFKDQIKKIHDGLYAAEEAIALGCRAMIEETENKPDNYSLTRGARQGRQGDGDNFNQLLTRELDISRTKLRRVAAACELIGNHQVGLSALLGGRDAAGNPAAFVRDEWYRGVLPEVGTIGYGYNGPFPDYERLVNATEDLLFDEGKNSNRVAEALIATVLDYEAQDDAIQAELDRLVTGPGGIDDYPLSKGNDPNDPASSS